LQFLRYNDINGRLQQDLSAWEPLLEWSIVNFDVQKDGNTQLSCITCDETINFNITSSLIVSLVALQVDADMARDITAMTPQDLFVVNKCGVPISFKLLNERGRDQVDVSELSAREEWTPIGQHNLNNIQAVPRQHTRLSATHQEQFDPTALGSRGELNTNYVIIHVDVDRGSRHQDGGMAYRPLRPQSLSTSGTFKHFLLPTDTVREVSCRDLHTPEELPFVTTVVERKNGATYTTVESPVLITNRLPVDLRVEFSDAAGFATEFRILQREAQIPVPLHLVSRRLRFMRHSENSVTGSGWRWSDYIQPGDESISSVVLMSPSECFGYCVYMDNCRGPRTSNVVIHCPIKLENLLPVPVVMTVARLGSKRVSKKHSGKQHVVYETIRLEKGSRVVPPRVDIRYGMTLSIEVDGLEHLAQKRPVLIWHAQSGAVDTKVKMVDHTGKRLTLRLAHVVSSGQPTLVSLFAPHWIINETGLPLQYYDVSGTGASRPQHPPNHELRKWRSPIPFMFSFRKSAFNAGADDNVVPHKFGIGLSGKPEKSFSLNHPELCTIAEVTSLKANGLPRSIYSIVCYVTLGSGPFIHTKMVHLRHFLHIRNCTNRILMLRQLDSDVKPKAIGAGATIPFSWSNHRNLAKQMQLHYCSDAMRRPEIGALPSNKIEWSAPFEVIDVGEFWLKVRSTDTDYGMLRLSVINERTTSRMSVVISEEQTPPYRLENYLFTDVGYRQQGTEYLHQEQSDSHGNWKIVKPRHSMHFTWDLPLGSQMLDLRVCGRQFTVDINTVGPIPTLRSLDGHVAAVSVEVVIEKHTRVLKLFADADRLSSFQAYGVSGSLDTQVSDRFCKVHVWHLTGDYIEMDCAALQVIEARIHSIGFSIVENSNRTPAPVELLYCIVDGIYVHQGQSAQEYLLEIKIADWQISNQLQNANPTVLLGKSHSRLTQGGRFSEEAAGTAAESISGTEDHLHLSMAMDLLRSSEDVSFFHYVGACLRPSELNIQDTYVMRLVGLGTDVYAELEALFPSYFGGDASNSPTTTVTDQGPTELTELAQQKIYFRKLELHPIHLFVTVQVVGGAISKLPRALQSLGVAFGNIDHAPLQFSALLMDNTFDRADEIYSRIYTTYIRQIVTGSYKVLGAADFLGNPVNLVQHLSSGIVDLFYLPARGCVTSPNDVVQGFARGVESLVGHTLKGLMDSAGGITASLGKGLETMAADDQFSVRMQKLRANHKESFEEGVEAGIEALALGLASGLAGTVLQPLRGLRRQGLKGLIVGVERGLVGAVAKPVSGALAMTAEAARAIAHSQALGRTGVSDQLQRVRIPRPFIHGRILTMYDGHWAAECEQYNFAPPVAQLCVTLYAIVFAQSKECSAWPHPLRAVASAGSEGKKTSTGVALVDKVTGIAKWRNGHFNPIVV
jgi:hypothetical protein